MALTHSDPPERWTRDDVTVTDPSVIRTAIGAAAIGNITEWYDFGVYAYFEPTIAKVFFSDQTTQNATLMTFGLFAVSFLIRPIGGFVLGPLADVVGRNKVLAGTMILMALGTFGIGCIPNPTAIGIWAPLLLLVCRLVQGFSTGGEYGNAMTFIAEYAPDKRRGFYGSWLEVGTFMGYLLGAIAVAASHAAFTDQQLLDWAWRIPFYVALPLGIVGVYLRKRLGDTPAFERMEELQVEDPEREEREPKEMIRELMPFMLVCMGLVIAWNVTNYMLTSYMPTYVATTLPAMNGAGIDARSSELAQIVVMAVALVTIPVLGHLSDKVGRKPIARVGAIGITVLALPMVWLTQQRSTLAVGAGLMIMALFLICFSATMPSTLPTLFPTKVRSGGLSIAFNIAISLFCGTTSLITGSFVAATGDINGPAYYLMIAGVIGLVSLHFLPEPNGQIMWDSTPSFASDDEADAWLAAQRTVGTRSDAS